MNCSDDVVHVASSQLRGKGNAYGLTAYAHGVRIVFRFPAEGRPIVGMLGDTEVMNTDPYIVCCHRIQELITSETRPLLVDQQSVQMKCMSRFRFRLRGKHDGQVG